MRHQCPIKGYEDFALVLPDTWKVRHFEAWGKGNRQAAEAFGEGVTVRTTLLFGSVALCEQIEGRPAESIEDWPIELFNWIIDTVFTGNFEKALNPPKNS